MRGGFLITGFNLLQQVVDLFIESMNIQGIFLGIQPLNTLVTLQNLALPHCIICILDRKVW